MSDCRWMCYCSICPCSKVYTISKEGCSTEHLLAVCLQNENRHSDLCDCMCFSAFWRWQCTKYHFDLWKKGLLNLDWSFDWFSLSWDLGSTQTQSSNSISSELSWISRVQVSVRLSLQVFHCSCSCCLWESIHIFKCTSPWIPRILIQEESWKHIFRISLWRKHYWHLKLWTCKSMQILPVFKSVRNVQWKYRNVRQFSAPATDVEFRQEPWGLFSADGKLSASDGIGEGQVITDKQVWPLIGHHESAPWFSQTTLLRTPTQIIDLL